LRRLTEFDETAYAPNLELARLLEEEGDLVGAAEALERAVWIYPYEMDPHMKLAELAGAAGKHDQAVRERRAVVALGPTDLASAQYELARALLAAGQVDAARTEVLRALEAAPGYEEAQQLLLQIHERS
jgi:tetratricopeptide (TPR) repeat protein